MKKIVFYFDQNIKKILIEKKNEAGEKEVVLSTPHNFVSASEIVAKVIEIDDEDQIPTRLDSGYTYFNIADYVPLKNEHGIYFDPETKAYKAQDYGFVIYNQGKLRLLPVLSKTRDKIKAYFMIHPTKFKKIPSFTDIDEIINGEKILTSIGQKKIEEQLAKIDVGNPKLIRVLVAKGKEPVNGHNEYYVPLMSFEKKAGEIMSDGSIDYKEVGSIVQITKRQELLKKISAQQPVNGFDIYGDKIFAEMEEPDGYKLGDNIVKTASKEGNIYASAIDGCIVVENKKISVLPVAVIKSDINYETGNIDFNGSVHIFGSVLAGFSVKATGDIIIENTIEDSFIEAGGDVIVKMGVVGKESVKIITGGSLNAKYLLNAKVESAGVVTVEDSIINCNVFSNDKISVVAKSGKIIGGEIIALNDITVKVAGAPNETTTNMKVGRNLFIEAELQEIREEITKLRDQVVEIMRQLKVNFGEGVFEDPKKYLSILPPVKKKKCLLLLKELGSSNKELKFLNEKSKEVQQRLKLDKEPFIKIIDKIYPGVVLNIKKSVRKIEEITSNVRFYEDPEEKRIRFTSAL